MEPNPLHISYKLKLSALTLSFLLISACEESPTIQETKLLHQEAQLAIDDKSFVTAITKGKNALEAYTELNDSLGMAETSYLVSRASALTDNFDQAIIYGEQASELLQRYKNYPLEYKVNNILSWSYFTKGKGFDEVLAHNNRQLFVVDQLNDPASKAMVYNNYGYDATVSGEIPLKDAIGYMQFANDFYAEEESTQGRWYTLMNLTWQHRLINDLAKSEEYGNKAVKQAVADKDRHAIIEAYTNLGETLLAQGNIEKAEIIFQFAKTKAEEQDDRDKHVFNVYYARYLWAIGQKDEAINRLKTAIDSLKEGEIFYEMLARGYLAEYSYLNDDLMTAQRQLNVFDNPRGHYFSQEAEVIAGIVEAKLLAPSNPSEALAILIDLSNEVDKSGATFLLEKIEEAKIEIGPVSA